MQQIMDNKKQITVIGATGNLGAPVAKHLLNSGFQIKAIVRNPGKANQIFAKHENIEIQQADLHDVDSLKKVLTNTEYLYLNLSTNTINIETPFAEEREGIENILKAIDKESIKQIIAISGLGALDNVNTVQKFKFIPNIIRKQGHKLIKDSGIPYTILHCSWFIDSFIFFQRNKVYSVIGNANSTIYFTNCYDYAQNLINAIGNEKAFFKEFPVQGKTGYSHLAAAEDFLAIFSEDSKAKILPHFIIRVLALFSKELKFVKHMSDYAHASIESFIAEDFGTYSILSEPVFEVKEYAKWLKSNNFYKYLNLNK
jgi:nucleoside-diphosphate-sugar epimerase